MRAAAWRALAPAALALALFATRARASYEEFQSFDVVKQEEDDENLLDHVLSRPPNEWRDEWERTPNAFRTSEGCFTAGLWHLVHDLRMRTPMGRKAFMDLRLRETMDVESAYQWLQFEFRFPLGRAGLAGVRFRPDFDKSNQDFAAMWDVGDTTGTVRAQAVFTVEDAFNKLWTFRQTRVGDDSAPYEVHPFEPALRMAWRPPGGRVVLDSRWMTPSRKRFDTADPTQRRRDDLEGSKHAVSIEQSLGGWTASAALNRVEVLTSETHLSYPGDDRVYRRRWLVEGHLFRRLPARWLAEAQWYYQDRSQDWRPPLVDASFRAVDRMEMFELDRAIHEEGLVLRLGVMYNKITVAERGAVPDFTWGSRKESRAFVGLQARFGRVHVQGIEGIELDSEPYQVTFHHDKGFLQMQTTF